jgi:hypothetical protein
MDPVTAATVGVVHDQRGVMDVSLLRDQVERDFAEIMLA